MKGDITMSKSNKPWNKNKSKNKAYSKGSSKTGSKSTKQRDEDVVVEDDRYHNDPSDYIPNEMLRKQVGSFTYNTTIGIRDVLQTSSSEGDIFGSTALGNIMQIDLFANIGVDAEMIGTSSPRTGINAAALKLYNKYSADNGKTTKYLPEDIAMAIVMVGEIESAIAHYQRAYGIAFTMNYRNRTFPKNLLKAMGFNPDDFMLHLSESRLRMNSLISRCLNIRIPKSVNYLKKCYNLYSHIFYDKGSAMGQYYVTRPYGFFKYYEEYVPGDERDLVEAQFYILPENISVSSYLDVVEDMIDRVLSSSLFNYVFTDVVRNAQRQGVEMLGFDYIPEIYMVVPEFSEMFMTQVHNATWGFFDDLSTYKISDSVQNLSIYSNLTIKKDVSTEGAKRVSLLYGGDQILDFPYTDNPTYDDAIDAVAFKTSCDYLQVGGANDGEYAVRAIPDHPIHGLKMNRLMTWSNGTILNDFVPVQFAFDLSDTATLPGIMHVNLGLETFDVRPLRYLYYDDRFPRNVEGALNFWTTVHPRQLARIFDFYFLGLFDADVHDTGINSSAEK